MCRPRPRAPRGPLAAPAAPAAAVARAVRPPAATAASRPLARRRPPFRAQSTSVAGGGQFRSAPPGSASPGAQEEALAYDKTRPRPKLGDPAPTWQERLLTIHPAVTRASDRFRRAWERYLEDEKDCGVTVWDKTLDKVFRRKPSMTVCAADEITWYEIKDYLDAGVKLKVLIDVREPQEFAQGCIPGAQNLPLKNVLSGMWKIDRKYIEDEKRRVNGDKAAAAAAAWYTVGSERDPLGSVYGDEEVDPLRLPSYIFYCSNGVRARMAQAMAKVDLGLGHRALLYPGSYNEWARFKDYDFQEEE